MNMNQVYLSTLLRIQSVIYFVFFFLTVQTGSPQTPPIFQDILHLLHTMAARSQESFNTGSCNKDLTHHKPVWLCHHARSEPP